MKILYVVSTLGRSGPTNQLLNIVRGLLNSNCFEPVILTLSPEPKDSLKNKFDELGVELLSLEMSRFQGILRSKAVVLNYVKKIAPSVVHSQGIRADSILSKLNLNIPWVMTSRNYPHHDYPMKFGLIKGKIMAYSHINAMRKCDNVVACSKTISNLLLKHSVVASPIQNGVHIDTNHQLVQNANLSKFEAPVFISVGSLIPRKNMQLIVEAFNRYSTENKGSLVILGGGPEQSALQAQSKSERIHILGSVSNVREYLSISDYFVSASLSEGLPNTVLEGLASGLPALLSDIPSHEEIHTESAQCSHIFELDEGVDGLYSKMTSINNIFADNATQSAARLAQTVFSAESMSQKYQTLYQELLK